MKKSDKKLGNQLIIRIIFVGVILIVMIDFVSALSCPVGYHPSNSGSSCLPQDQVCNPPCSLDWDGACACLSSPPPSRDSSECRSDSDCSGKCNNGLIGFYPHPSRCVKCFFSGRGSGCGECGTDLDCAKGGRCVVVNVETDDATTMPPTKIIIYSSICQTFSGKCSSSHDCQVGKICQDKTCIEGCESDSDCTGGKKCYNQQCIMTACTSDNDCSQSLTGKKCNVNTGLCVQCVSDNNCFANDPNTPNKKCDSANKCVQCVSSTDCSNGLKCYKEQCKQCLSNNDCTAEQKCFLNDLSCLNNGKCSSIRDCGIGQICAGEGICNNLVCYTTADCPSGRECSGFKCVVSSCSADNDCASGQKCSGGQCTACTSNCAGKNCGDDTGCGGSCGVCEDGKTCNANGVCSGTSITTQTCSQQGGSCVFGSCSSGQTSLGQLDCSYANTCCKTGACTPDCTGKTCGDDTCGGSCGSCESGQSCSNGACVSETDNTQDCTDSDIDSNHLNGVNFYLKGLVKDKVYVSGLEDYCWNGVDSNGNLIPVQSSNWIAEYSCKENSITIQAYNCPNSCSNGECATNTNPVCGNNICEPGEDSIVCTNCGVGSTNLDSPKPNCIGGSCHKICEEDCGNNICSPKNCSQLGKNCGSVEDGCNETLNCGSDSTSCSTTFGTCTVSGTKTCVNGNYGNCQATDPRTANCNGKKCGSDGCSGSCGSCSGNTAKCNANGKCVQCLIASSDCASGESCDSSGTCYCPFLNRLFGSCAEDKCATKDCNDNNACTIDSCTSPDVGICVHTPKVCPGGQVCSNGNCISSKPSTIGLYDPTASVFYLRNSNDAGYADTNFMYGAAGNGWTPIVGDWNGDGKDTIGLYDPTASVFYLRNSNDAGYADVYFMYGPANSGWKPIVGDWNGDGKTTIGLYDPTASVFYLRNSNDAGYADTNFMYGAAGNGWTPIVGYWGSLTTLVTCTPKNCAQLGKSCGSASDECGGTVNCGSCSAGYNCNNGVCTTTKTCPSCNGKTCGASDGCGGICKTGSCPTTQEYCASGVCKHWVYTNKYTTIPGMTGPDCKLMIAVTGCPSGKHAGFAYDEKGNCHQGCIPN
jgi:hypothetical protein